VSITFSTIGTCTAPAAVCVEGYSPRDGRAHGSLDVVVYACEKHAEVARTEWLASLTPYGTTPVPGPRCGEMTTFTEPADEPVHAALQPSAPPAVHVCVRCQEICDVPIRVRDVDPGSGPIHTLYGCLTCAPRLISPDAAWRLALEHAVPCSDCRGGDTLCPVGQALDEVYQAARTRART
jgi:hypothetical protein